MRAVVQRVSSSSVSVDGEVVGEIGSGLLVLLGVGKEDSKEDLDYIYEKIINLRVFEDEEGKMNKSAVDLGLDIQVVSQFTLYGDVRKGRRPSFTSSADPEAANELYERLLEKLRENESLSKVAGGKFKAHMQVKLENDGPVTILLDSKKEF